jgi:hypothetical protein
LLLDLVARAAAEVHEYRTVRAALVGGENIDQVFGMRAGPNETSRAMVIPGSSGVTLLLMSFLGISGR